MTLWLRDLMDRYDQLSLRERVIVLIATLLLIALIWDSVFMGPLDKERPWSTADIVGVHRFLQRMWRNLVDEDSGSLRVTDAPADPETRRVLHRTIAAVRDDMAAMSFNTAIARLFELNNHLTGLDATPREVKVVPGRIVNFVLA